MTCKHCGTENQSGFKFCVKCGRKLEIPKDIDQVGMNGYHSEGETASGGFTMGKGTFTVNDRPPVHKPTDLYSADGLNRSESAFDNEEFDEPFIPKLNADRVSLPEQILHPSHQPLHNMVNSGNMQGYPNQPYQGMPNQMQNAYQQQGMPQQMNSVPQMNGMPNQQVYAQPQFIGYDQNGMPLYGQPVMYQQPQIIGYDPNGMPVYAQPVMYQQPQIIGYDQNGMPLYGQPMMYQQPQISGYDQNGMPLYAQPAPYQNVPAMQNMVSVQQPDSMMQGVAAPSPSEPEPVPQPEEEKRVDVPDDFWEFFDGGKATKHKETSAEDFFGKQRGGGMDDLYSSSGNDIDRLRRFERKRNDYMGDLPVADASKLRPNESEKYNKLYMRQTDMADANQLEFNQIKKAQDRMRVTGDVSADSLVRKQDNLKWNIMGQAEEARADQLESFVPKRNQAMMAQAGQAVEAMPSRKKTYNDLIDEIELPEYMKARRTVKTQTVEIPGIPELQDMYKKG